VEKGKFKRKFSQNVCETIPAHRRRKVKVSITLDQVSEERLAVLVAYSKKDDFSTLSNIVNNAVVEYLEENQDACEELERCYREWKIQSK